MEFGYDGKHGAYQPHVIRGPMDPTPHVAAAMGTLATAPASHPAHAPSSPPDASKPAPSAAPESSRAATHCGKKQNILIKGLKTMISMCRSNDALIHESHQQMNQRLSLLEERQREMHTYMGFETLEPIVYHLFLLQLWKTRGLSTTMPKEMMMMMMMMRSKKNLSEDFAFPSSLFGVDAKGGEDLYLFSYFLISWIVISD
jgi:hypothetical protein